MVDGDDCGWWRVLRSIGCADEYGCGMGWVGVVGKM